MSEECFCPVCGGKTKIHFNLPTPYLERQYDYKIMVCKSCYFHFAIGPDDDEVLSRIYEKSFHGTSQQFAPVDFYGDFSKESKKFPVVLNAIERSNLLHQLGMKGSLLDIGAGRGYFVKAASEFFDAEGLELSADAEMYGEQLGINLYSGNFFNYDFHNKLYDNITLWDVLSSLREPNQVIIRIKEILTPNGTLIMTLPRVNGWVPRLLGRYWPLWIPPVNLNYFSDQSLDIFLKRHGFVPIFKKCVSKKVAVSFLLIKLSRVLGGIHFFDYLATLIPDRWTIKLNLHDILTVVAVRSEEQP